jgi:hypothetical protein
VLASFVVHPEGKAQYIFSKVMAQGLVFVAHPLYTHPEGIMLSGSISIVSYLLNC